MNGFTPLFSDLFSDHGQSHHFATADFLDYHGPLARFFDGFDRLALAGVARLARLNQQPTRVTVPVG